MNDDQSYLFSKQENNDKYTLEISFYYRNKKKNKAEN